MVCIMPFACTPILDALVFLLYDLVIAAAAARHIGAMRSSKLIPFRKERDQAQQIPDRRGYMVRRYTVYILMYGTPMYK